MEFKQGMVHVLGDTLEIFPPGQDTVIRVEMPFDEIETIQEVETAVVPSGWIQSLWP